MQEKKQRNESLSFFAFRDIMIHLEKIRTLSFHGIRNYEFLFVTFLIDSYYIICIIEQS